MSGARQDGLESRLRIIRTRATTDPMEFATEVRSGLTARPKHLPCRFLYDEVGSALFEEICTLAEYYPTRSEREILADRAGEIVASMDKPITLAELGSGSAVKTRILIEEILRVQERLRYTPVDISPSVLEESSRALLSVHPRLEITALAGEYEEGIGLLARETPGPKLILWLGSNIGNLERDEAAKFLRRIGDVLSASDRILLGVDLRKDPKVIQAAYDDAQGVTARFSLNLLARINRELGGHFDLRTFRHRAVYVEDMGRVEIHLVSTIEQRVAIDALGLEVPFEANETIHTENSYKYAPEEIATLARAANLTVETRWEDAGRRFTVCLLRPKPAPRGRAARAGARRGRSSTRSS